MDPAALSYVNDSKETWGHAVLGSRIGDLAGMDRCLTLLGERRGSHAALIGSRIENLARDGPVP